jgi:hypothetical protein
LLLTLLALSASAQSWETIIADEVVITAEVTTFSKGEVRLPDAGKLIFERAEWWPDTQKIAFYNAAISDRSDGLILTGEVVTSNADGTFSIRAATVTTCDWEGRTPWEIRARDVTVDEDDVRLSWGVARLFEVPLLVVPYVKVPTKRKSGFLLPQFSTGSQGVLFATPYYQTLGKRADMTITPEVRTGRAARLLTDTRYVVRGGGGHVAVDAGWDGVDDAVRGSASWSHGSQGRHLMVASEGNFVSDLGYWADFGTSLMDRGVPWGSGRALARVGPVEIGSRLYQMEEETTQAPFFATIDQGLTPIGGGFLMAGSLGVAATGQGDAPWTLDDPDLLALGSLWIERPATRVGAVELSPRLKMAGEMTPLSETASLGGVESAVMVSVPLYRKTATVIDRLAPVVDVGVTAGEAFGQFVAPGARWSSTTKKAQSTLTATWRFSTEESPALNVWGEVNRGGWRGWLDHQEQTLSGAGVGWRRPDVVRFDASVLDAPADALYQKDPLLPIGLRVGRVGGGVAVPKASLWLQSGLRWDLLENTMQSLDTGVRYQHPCGCLDVGMDAAWAVDRTLPDLRVLLELGG